MKKREINREVAVRLSGVRKQYKLGQIGGGSLQADLQSWWAKKHGREDPNSIIGQEQRLIGQSFMALNGIDLTIYKGEALGIIGSNGAGKSTLLKLLSRVTAPTEGEIDIYGRIASMLEVGTGFNGEMTGRENIYMNGAILGMTKTEIDAKMEDIIEFSEVREFIDTPVKRYSSGMYVKLAFSVAAHLDSEIMIMDEVLAVGDMAFQKKCLDKMREASNTEGRTVLYVSHNMNTIKQLCDRCIVLDKGKVVFDGGVEEAIEVYLGIESNENTVIDYSDIPRLNWLRLHKVRTIKAEYVGKNSIQFDGHEEMRIRLEWINEQDIPDLCLRIELLRLDRTPIATSMAYHIYDAKRGTKASGIFLVDYQGLVPGKYTMNFTFFEKNEFGGNTDVDCVHGLYFDVVRDEAIVWNERAWGSIQLPDLLVEEISI